MTITAITWMINQTAVYWAPSGTDSFGQPTWGTPVEIGCRWEDVAEEFMDAVGERRLSSSRVYVDEEVEVQGMLLLGELSSSVDQSDPKANEGAWEIRKFDKLPDIDVEEYLLTAYL